MRVIDGDAGVPVHLLLLVVLYAQLAAHGTCQLRYARARDQERGHVEQVQEHLVPVAAASEKHKE